MTHGPLEAYHAKLESGELKFDPAQEMAVSHLQTLNNALAGYRPPLGASAGGGWLAKLGMGAKAPPQGFAWMPGGAGEVRQGLYIFGEVGRGKSMLMDLFFAHAPVAKKRRIHFHELMREVHEQIHRWRKDGSAKESDPLPRLARSIASDAWLLCLDELQITDIADAMIVGRLFHCLLDDGVVVVITSNRPPRDLYKDGLQRDRFLPFIALIERRLDLLSLEAETDYRLGRKRGMQVYHWPSGQAADLALEMAFHRLTEGSSPMPNSFEVNGRQVRVPLAAAGVAWFSFSQLCGTALGPSDYLDLATRYHTLVLSDIPLLSPANKDEARRFVTLVDALYEHKVTLVCSAAAAPERLYPEGIGAFEFQRTVSRLMEMQSEDYVTREHVIAAVSG